MALILTVTDEPHVLLEVRRDLEASGHQVVLAADADTARKRLASLSIELIVLDVMMPVRDGWALLQAARDGPRPLPVLVISGRAGPLDLARAQRLGATGSLSAPFSAERLNQAVARALLGAG